MGNRPIPERSQGHRQRQLELVTQFQVGSAWNCQSLDLSYKAHLGEITKEVTCKAFPAGIESIKVGELDPQCRGMSGVIFSPLCWSLFLWVY